MNSKRLVAIYPRELRSLTDVAVVAPSESPAEPTYGRPIRSASASLTTFIPEEHLQRRLAAILAADVVGYSRLAERNERSILDRLKTYRKELVEPLLGKHCGRIVKLTGDGM